MFQDFKSEIRLLLIVALVAVVLAVGGIFLLKAMQPASPASGPTPAVQTPPPAAPSPQPQAINNQQSVFDTTGWQTYRYEELGFEFQYPKELAEDPNCKARRGKEDEAPGVHIGNSIGIMIFDTRGLSLGEFASQNQAAMGAETVRQSVSKIGGEDAITVSFRTFLLGRLELGEYTYVFKEGEGYLFLFSPAVGDCSVFDELDLAEYTVLKGILATFRFVE